MALIAGVITFKIDSVAYNAVGAFDYNLGFNKREALVGHDKTHGYKELPQVAYIEGEIRDAGDLDLKTLMSLTNSTITLNLANGKVVTFPNAFYAGDGKVGSEEANIEVRFECGGSAPYETAKA